MVQECKGVCEQYKAESMPTHLRYKSGQKMCGVCNNFFSIKEFFCPCCNTKLRSKPRNRKIWKQ